MRPFLILAAVLCFGYSRAQGPAQPATITDTIWRTGGVFSLNFSQTHLSNWQGGGQSAINGTALMNVFANYAKGKWTWENNLIAQYGTSRIGEDARFRKTDDKLEFSSKAGRETFLKNVYYTSLFTFRTQMDAGYDFESIPPILISDPLAPAYVFLGLGFDYKPSPAFSAYISPITAKATIVDNQRLADQGAFGVDPAEYDAMGNKTKDGENLRIEVGAYFKMQYTKDVFENVKLDTKLDLFSNYLDNPQNIDVNWETLIAMKINKFLSASISTHLIYDDDVRLPVDRNGNGMVDDPADGTGPRIQFKEVFSLGLQYQF